MQSSDNTLEELVSTAIMAVETFDEKLLEETVTAIGAGYGWETSHAYLNEKIIETLTPFLTSQPNVGDIVNFVQALFPYVSEILNIAQYEYEFLIRGLAGAEEFLNGIPIDLAVVMELAIIGCAGMIQPGQFIPGEPAYDITD